MLSASMRQELKELKEGYARKIAAIDEILDEKPTIRDIDTDPIPRGGRMKAIADAAYSVLAKAARENNPAHALRQTQGRFVNRPYKGDGGSCFHVMSSVSMWPLAERKLFSGKQLRFHIR